MARLQQLLSAALFLLLSGSSGGTLVSGTLAEGTKWETPYYVVKGPKPGPTVFLTGGLHGNEPAGALAAEQIRHWAILMGRLVVLPRANQPGLKAETRHLPDLPREHADLNRNFPSGWGEGHKTFVVDSALPWTGVYKGPTRGYLERNKLFIE